MARIGRVAGQMGQSRWYRTGGIVLTKAGHLDLLGELADEILVPDRSFRRFWLALHPTRPGLLWRQASARVSPWPTYPRW